MDAADVDDGAWQVSGGDAGQCVRPHLRHLWPGTTAAVLALMCSKHRHIGIWAYLFLMAAQGKYGSGRDPTKDDLIVVTLRRPVA